MNKRNSIFLSCLLLIYILANSCANQGSPTGGPRDTIPPVVINSVPLNQAINFKGRTLTFEFDERVSAEKLKQKLIITPNTELEFSFITKKNLLTVKFQNELRDSTTYNFNFLDGVTDITEKNPVVNFRLAFSTGPFIDSIYVTGISRDLLTGLPSKNITIGLYNATDTTNIYEDKPLYFFTTDEQGSFKIENIKTGLYNIYAWYDKNKNLKLETDQEAYAFLQDTLDLYTSKDSIYLRVLGIDTNEPEILTARAAGRYFDVKLNKRIASIEVQPDDSSKQLAYQHLVNEKLIRFYNTQQLADEDSLIYYVSITDSLQQSYKDTLSVKFRSTKKKPDKFELGRRKTNEQVTKSLSLQLTFSKPVGQFNQDSIYIAFDTLSSIPLYIPAPDTLTNDSTQTAIIPAVPDFTWNNTRTQLTLDVPVDWTYINDSITATNAYFIQQDTLNPDSTRAPFNPILNDKFTLKIPKGAILSVEQDTLDVQSFDYRKEDIASLGKFILNISTDYQNYWIEIVEKERNEVVRSIKVVDEQQITVSRLKPGTYKFVIRVDDNNDGVWSYGSILENKEAETIIHTGVESSLRANFDVNIDLPF